jgi:hypothetical protein
MIVSKPVHEVRAPAMNPFAGPTMTSRGQDSLSIELTGNALGSFPRAISARIQAWLSEAHRALEAEKMYTHHWHKSDDDQAKGGVPREDVAQLIKTRLY